MATEEDCRNQFSTFLFDDSCLFSERLRDFSPDADSSTTSSRGFPLGGRDENCPPAVGGGGILVDFLEEGVGIFEPVPPEVGEGLLLAERTAVEREREGDWKVSIAFKFSCDLNGTRQNECENSLLFGVTVYIILYIIVNKDLVLQSRKRYCALACERKVQNFVHNLLWTHLSS